MEPVVGDRPDTVVFQFVYFTGRDTRNRRISDVIIPIIVTGSQFLFVKFEHGQYVISTSYDYETYGNTTRVYLENDESKPEMRNWSSSHFRSKIQSLWVRSPTANGSKPGIL